jgi:hypothetical protein
MKKNQFLILILIFFVSCKQEKNKTVVTTKKPLHVETKKVTLENDSISGKIHPELGVFNFKFISDTAHLELNKIIIYHKGKVFQTIRTKKESYGDDKYGLIDWNIDGYKDISVLWNRGATGNSAYWIWSYSPRKNKFVYNKELSGAGILIDSTAKYVIFHWRNGCEYEFWDSCKYINNKLHTVRSLHRVEWNDGNGNIWVKNVREKMTHGILKVTADSSILVPRDEL